MVFGPKEQDLGFLLNGHPYPTKNVGEGGATEKGLRRKPIVGFILNFILCSSLPQHHHLSAPKKVIKGVCVCAGTHAHECVHSRVCLFSYA